MKEDDIFQAFASAAQDNYRGTQPARQQSVGLFNFTSSSTGSTPKPREDDLEGAPQIRLDESREARRARFGEDEEEKKEPQSHSIPQVSLERG